MTNKIDYFEIGSPDPEASKAFYATLFNWEIGEPSMPARYSMIDEARGGATVVMPFTDNGAIEFAHLVDPLGNRFGIWRPKPS